MRKLVLLMMMFLSFAAGKAQNSRTITGTVYGADDKLPLPGVSVKIDGTTIGTQTNASGRYSINVPQGNDKLIFSFIGYQYQEVKIGKKDKINVYMKADTRTLNEVAVATGEYKRREAMANSSQPVHGSTSDLSKALSGKVSGLQVNSAAKTKVLTRGYAPPADYSSESYKAISESGFKNPADEPLSTFSIDVDAASYSNVRRFINNGQLPPKDAVRVEEMINYFSYNTPAPVNNEPVAILTELSSAPWNTQHRLLRVSLKAKNVAYEKLPASNLVFLIDVSGSMQGPNRLPLVQSSMKMLVDQLRPQDKVAIVVYAGAAGEVLSSTPGSEKQKIKNAIDALQAGGSTAGGAGIKLAYGIAKQNFMKNGNNRVILATDGDFNVGASSDEDMQSLIEKERESGIFLSVLGYGMGNFKDSKMETLADKGNGNYAYIDNITEARKTLVSEFGGTLFTVAKDVKLQIEFNPAKIQAYRLVGYENRLLNKEDFNNDKKDAGDMGAGHTVTAFYEIVPAGVKDNYVGSVDPLKYQKTKGAATYNGGDEMMTIKFRYKEPSSSVSKLAQAILKDQPVALASTSADFRFAASVAEFGMLLRGSDYKHKASFDQAIQLAKASKGADNEGYRAEFIRLAESAKLLAKTELASTN